MDTQIRITGEHYNKLKKHLFPKDGKEAVAVALCGRFSYESSEYLLVNDLTLIPYDECYSRDSDILTWSTKRIIPYFKKINRSNMAIMKIHSHPGGYDEFSDLDDNSDYEFFESVFGWAINDKPHASAIMLPDGSIKGRFFSSDLSYNYVDKISIAGDTIIQYEKFSNERNNDFALRTIQAFGDKTYKLLSNLKIGVVGCSGTGSPIIEQLVRLGVGSLFLVDSDIVEFKNLNRIINSKRNDVILKHSKVEAISNAIKEIGLDTNVITSKNNLYNDIHTLKSLVKCDVIFGCMDTVDGRHLLNQLCSFI
ncbi:MAG: HesA/MoeB/ThiF family protein [Bacteroidales bacterium]